MIASALLFMPLFTELPSSMEFSEVRVYGVLERWSPAPYRLGLAASV
jgi:hypothetical protein